MLTRLFIQHFVLIEQTDISFERGLCVLTGETGAGKSILLDALSLPLGARAESGWIRKGHKQSTVIAEFDISHVPQASAVLHELGLSPEDNLILRRVLSEDGKTRCFINDQPVSVAALKQVGDTLLEIHGQHEQRGLLNPATHMDLLDTYGELEPQLKAVETAYHAWRASEKALEQYRSNIAALRQQQEYLQHMHKELHSLNPKEGEEQELADRRTQMMQSEKLHQLLHDVLAELQGSKPVMAALSTSERLLSRSSMTKGASFDEVLKHLQVAHIEASEAIDKLETLSRESVYDPLKLEQMEERLFSLRAAARKFQTTVDALPQKLEDVSAKLATLDIGNTQEKQLSEQCEKTEKLYVEVAQKLHEKRKKNAQKMMREVSAELEPLKMSSTQFEISLEELSKEYWNASGITKLAFLVATNKGSASGPLHKIASGGELSRFMLAMKVVLAGVKSTPCLIFDEIDTGTGGAVADAIGKRLAKLGDKHQVFVVTHLPQVAAAASQHYRVSKQVKKTETFTDIVLLSRKEREEEMARMLAGEEITPEARKAALQLMKAAQ